MRMLSLVITLSAFSSSAGFITQPCCRSMRRVSVDSSVNHPGSDFVFVNGDNDDDDNDCNIMAALGDAVPSSSKKKMIFLMSDSTGFTAKSMLQASLQQFDTEAACDGSDLNCVHTRVFTFVKGEQAAAAIIKKASQFRANTLLPDVPRIENSANEANSGGGCLLLFTLSNRDLRQKVLRMCELSGVPAIDLLGPTFDGLGRLLGQSPTGPPLPFQMRKYPSSLLSDAYYRRIGAMEFTLDADDGQAPWLLKNADIILVGVSRTGKTPLSVVLSQTMGLKVANVPLVLEVAPPKELINDEENIDHNRVFCLTLSPPELRRIRQTRLERRNVRTIEQMNKRELEQKSNYADRAYLLKDLKKARDLATEYGWTEIDVTGRAVEETATYIIELMTERFDRIKLC